MSLTAIIIAALALLAGVGVGYYLRLVISLGQKGSMELEIKQMMIGAKEDAQKVIDEAKKKAEEKVAEMHVEEKKKEAEWKQTEARLIKKEELLDARQGEIDKEVENIKVKVEEVKICSSACRRWKPPIPKSSTVERKTSWLQASTALPHQPRVK